MTVEERLYRNSRIGKKSLAILIDPDKVESDNSLLELVLECKKHNVDYFLVGGSLITTNNFNHTIYLLKSNCDIPVIIFPGSVNQIDPSADAILFLSLISGRNPEFLIGNHVTAAPLLRSSGIEVIPTGYMLIGNEHSTTVSYMSNTVPIPKDKVSVGVATAMAGEMLGLKLCYLEAGSGAKEPVPSKMIFRIKANTSFPIFVGGGLNSIAKVEEAIGSGADVVVMGNSIERDPALIGEVSKKISVINDALNIH